MIRITCTNCKAQLSIDEAFAGGACRCQFCGTIQTVPKHLKSGAAAESSQAKVGAGTRSPGTLYRNKSKPDTGLSSGLDAIAEVVASSGLSGSGLSSGNARRSKLTGAPDGEIEPVKNKMLPILLVAGVAIILLLGLVIGLLVNGSGNAGKPAAGDGTSATPDANSNVNSSGGPDAKPPANLAARASASFFGVKLTDPTIIFVLDRGSGTRDSFEYMKMACANALEALQPNQKYQVIFWKLDRDNDPVAFPGGLTGADQAAELKKTEKAMDDVNSLGQSDVGPALQKAFSANPSLVVIATGKSVDDGFVKAVMDARKSSTTKVDCLSLNEPGSSKAMRDVTRKTGGTFKLVSLGELQSVTR